MFNLQNYIAVDWGSSNLRLWLFQQGEAIWTYHSREGVTHQRPGAFKELWLTILSRCPHPLAPDTIVIMSGMIGSNLGWLAVPYIPCPTSVSALSSNLTPVENAGPLPVWIVPGLQLNGPEHFNVMRGEETQLLGALNVEEWYVFPGTHSKWVRMERERIGDFQTIMTGEFFHLLSHYSVLSQPQDGHREDHQAFLDGARLGAQECCLSRGTFALRARMLCGALPSDTLHSALSGLLIGHEVARMYEQYAISSTESVVLVGNDALLARYQSVFTLFGLTCRPFSGEAAFLNGIRRLLHDHV